MEWETLRDWIIAFGDQYGVDPIIFAVLYFGTLPFVAVSMLWLVRNRRRRRAVGMPLFSVAAFSLPAHLYVAVESDNLPIWLYAVLAASIGYGLWRVFDSGFEH